MKQNDNCIECNKIVKPRQHSITCDSNLSLFWCKKAFYFFWLAASSTQNNKKALYSQTRVIASQVQYGPGLWHTKVVKNGNSCSSLGTQTYGVELGLVQPVSG